MDVLNEEDNRIVKIRAKKSKPPKGIPKTPIPKVPKVPKVQKVQKVPKAQKMPKKMPKKVPKKNRLKSDAAGIRSKAELGDNLKSKKITSKQVPNAGNTKPTKGADDRLNPPHQRSQVYLRMAGDLSSGTISHLGDELIHDTSLFQFDDTSVLSPITSFMRMPNLEQGVIFE